MEPIKVSIKPMLFAGPTYYPLGGWEDFQGFFDTVECAINHVHENKNDDWWQWFHVVVDGKIIVTQHREDNINGSKWINDKWN